MRVFTEVLWVSVLCTVYCEYLTDIQNTESTDEHQAVILSFSSANLCNTQNLKTSDDFEYSHQVIFYFLFSSSSFTSAFFSFLLFCYCFYSLFICSFCSPECIALIQLCLLAQFSSSHFQKNGLHNTKPTPCPTHFLRLGGFRIESQSRCSWSRGLGAAVLVWRCCVLTCTNEVENTPKFDSEKIQTQLFHFWLKNYLDRTVNSAARTISRWVRDILYQSKAALYVL